MALIKLISPDGDEVLVTESGVDGLKKNGYKDAPAPKKSSAKGKKDDADAGDEHESAADES